MSPTRAAAQRAHEVITGAVSEQRQVHRVRQDLSGSFKQPPKCRVQEETKEEQMPGLVDTRMDGADTTAPAKDMA